mgnify:CR=1 FL=1
MIHQPSAGTQGKVTDMEIDVEHFLKIKQRMNKILSENTGKTPEQVKLDSERDNWMTAEEARDYGLVDKVISRGNHGRRQENLRCSFCGKPEGRYIA